MARRAPIATAFFISISFCSITAAHCAAQSTLDRSMEAGQNAFDQGNYLKAQRFWSKAKLELQKSGTPDERLAKLSQQLGQAYFQDGKFADAETQYKQSLEITKSLNLDPTDINNKIADLNSKYRNIDLNSFDATAVKFSQTLGCLNATALNQEPNHHVDINLSKRFQQRLKELADNFLPKNPDGTTAVPKELEAAAKPNGGPEVKSLRLDKKITFDLVNENNGNLHLANIQGISFDVGLWAKLKELVLSQSANGAEAEVTAGAFGVEKKVKTTLPQSIYDRLKEGIAKFDPFSAQNVASSSGAISNPASTSAATTPSVPTNSTSPAGSVDAGASNSASSPTSSQPDSASKIE